MALITMTRVDARLVHGQVAGRWIKDLNADRVVIIDDETANDSFMVELFQLASPPRTKLICYTLEQAIQEWGKDQLGEGRVIVLFKDIPTAEKAWHDGMKYKELNIGQVPKGPGRKLAHATVHLSVEEVEVLEGLEKLGVRVYSQGTPYDKQQPLAPISKKIKS